MVFLISTQERKIKQVEQNNPEGSSDFNVRFCFRCPSHVRNEWIVSIRRSVQELGWAKHILRPGLTQFWANYVAH